VVLFSVWLILALLLIGLATRELSVPGLYYDEAIFAGLAKDFLTGNFQATHMPGTVIVPLFGRPFPVFVQSYLGALKCWLLMPGFAVFGFNVAALRLMTLGWGLIALLLFMLWTRRLLGLPAALVAGPLLGLDPAWFFLTVHDWGSVALSFLCRFAGFGLLLLWWQERKWHQLFLAALCFGLGVFNKVDFVVILSGGGLALLLTQGRPIFSAIRATPGRCAAGALGFLLVAVPMMIWKAVPILQHARNAGAMIGLAGKARLIVAMFDGSYFCRLMDAGGRLENAFDRPSPVWSPLGPVFLLASLFLIVEVTRHYRTDSRSRVWAFLLFSAVFTTAGFLLLPGAESLHHALLIYPFPQLIITAALVRIWPAGRAAAGRALRVASVVVIVLVLLAGHGFALQKTRRLIQETGGRGRWSNAMNEFCQEIRNQTNLTVISLDWGLNEQIEFLTDGPRLSEPFWRLKPPEKFQFDFSTNVVYLVHPPKYTFYTCALQIFDNLQPTEFRKAQIRAFTDRENQVAFYAIRFVPK
jgi:hypothetical protein